MRQDVAMGAKQAANWPKAGEATRAGQTYVPSVDIFETADNFTVIADMPGVAPDGIDITLERRVLTLRGRIQPREHLGYWRYHTEYGEGDYERSFALSEDIDRDKIEAMHKDGVLTIRLPKAAFAQSRKIEVKAS